MEISNKATWLIGLMFGVLGGGMDTDYSPQHVTSLTSIEEICEECVSEEGVIDKNRTAIVLVDMQDRVEYGSEYALETQHTHHRPIEVGKALRKVTQWEEKEENMKRVLRYAANNDIPVVILEYTLLGFTSNDLIRAVGSAEYKIIKKYSSSAFGKLPVTELKKVDGEWVESQGFIETEVEEHLESLDVETLVMMGFHRYDCVYNNAKDAVGLGYRVISAPDLAIGGEESQVLNADDVLQTPEDIRTKDQFFAEKTTMYRSVDELLKAFK
jgi:nicotinamidase-related amidase